MKRLDQYVLREFLSYVLLGLSGFIVIFIVVDIFEKISVFLDHQAPLLTIARFYVNLTPQVVVQVLPVALLLASFLALGQLNKFGELTAMRAAGISLLRILRPVFWVAAAATIVSLLLGEFVVPAANRERDRIYNGQIQKVQRQAVNERADFTYLGEGGRIFYVRLYLVNEKRMHEISMQEFRDRELVRRVDAAEAAWDGQQWIFTSGYERTFKDGRESARAFGSLAVPEIAERPPDFAKDVRKPDEMTFFELREHVEKLRSSGARVANYLVDLHIKLSFPLVNLIVVLIGASLATRLRMQSAALGFGLSIAISFLYYAFLRAGQALGHNGAMPPYVAAWFGDMVFGAVGLIMMAQAQRR